MKSKCVFLYVYAYLQVSLVNYVTPFTIGLVLLFNMYFSSSSMHLHFNYQSRHFLLFIVL